MDFIPLSTTLIFDSQSPGILCGAVALILDDDVAENDEVFTVVLEADGSNNNVEVLTNGSLASVTIISDDGKKIN